MDPRFLKGEQWVFPDGTVWTVDYDGPCCYGDLMVTFYRPGRGKTLTRAAACRLLDQRSIVRNGQQLFVL